MEKFSRLQPKKYKLILTHKGDVFELGHGRFSPGSIRNLAYSNLTLRQSVGYLGRRTTGHFRCIGKLERHLELVKCHYNFIRRHQSLRFGLELRTPAMIGGAADRVLSFGGIFLTSRQQQPT